VVCALHPIPLRSDRLPLRVIQDILESLQPEYREKPGNKPELYLSPLIGAG